MPEGKRVPSLSVSVPCSWVFSFTYNTLAVNPFLLTPCLFGLGTKAHRRSAALPCAVLQWFSVFNFLWDRESEM